MQPGGRFCSLSTSLTQRKINNKNKTVNARTHTHQKKKKGHRIVFARMCRQGEG